MRDLMLRVTCRECGKKVHIDVYAEDLIAWKEGKKIQEAFHYLTVDEREILISETCGECFDKLVGED